MAETTATPETTPAQTSTETSTETQAQEAPKYTDKQLNDLIAKNKGKGVEELPKTAGFQTQDELTKALADYKAMQDKNKTDAEKLADENKKTAEKLAEAEKKYALAEFRAEALVQGVNKEASEKVATWAQDYDGKTAEEKITAFLKDNPPSAQSEAKSAAPKISSKTVSQTHDAEAALLERLKKQM